MLHAALAQRVIRLAVLSLCCLPALAQEKKPLGSLTVNTDPAEGADAIKNRPVMVSILIDGNVAQQEEIKLGFATGFHKLPVGTVDVRVEGEGLQTLVKRGIQVRPDHTTTVIGGPMKPGQGVKTIEYATAAMPREDLAAKILLILDRLEKLEAAIAKLAK